MRDLVILGTGIHSLEMAEIVERINRISPMWNLLGHLSPREGEAGRPHGDSHILGSLNDVDRLDTPLLIADNEFPRPLAIPRDRLATLIDPSAWISKTATIGRGCVVYPHCFLGRNAMLSDFVFCLSSVRINHDCVIDEYCTLTTGVVLAGSVRVERNTYLGQSCTVRQQLRIGQDCLIGMGSVVVKDVEARSVMAGNPARRIRERKVH